MFNFFNTKKDNLSLSDVIKTEIAYEPVTDQRPNTGKIKGVEEKIAQGPLKIGSKQFKPFY